MSKHKDITKSNKDFVGPVQDLIDDELDASSIEITSESEVSEPVKKATLNSDVLQVTTNAALIAWATDPWGITKDLRQAFTRLATSVRGAEDKKAVADANIRIALSHFENKYIEDHARYLETIANMEKDQVEPTQGELDV